jgi:hypothetical protein
MASLINGAGRTPRWFIEDVWSHFDTDHARPDAPPFPSERKNAGGTCCRIRDDALQLSGKIRGGPLGKPAGFACW